MSIDVTGAALTLHAQPPPEGAVREERAALDFDDFYDAHVDFAWRVARRMGVPAWLLDDVVQDVFVVVHRRLASLDASVPPRAWLFRVVQNISREHARRERRSGHDLLGDEVVDGRNDPERSLSHTQEIALVDRIVRSLPEERRAVFILAECEQMTAPEIAAALDVNLNTVYTRIRLARADFEAALARTRRTPR